MNDSRTKPTSSTKAVKLTGPDGKALPAKQMTPEQIKALSDHADRVVSEMVKSLNRHAGEDAEALKQKTGKIISEGLANPDTRPLPTGPVLFSDRNLVKNIAGQKKKMDGEPPNDHRSDSELQSRQAQVRMGQQIDQAIEKLVEQELGPDPEKSDS